MRTEAITKGLAEFIGTFGLVFMGCSAIVMTAQASGFTNLVAVALAFGIAIMIGVAALGHVSVGHFNPAVTAAMLMTRRISVRLGVLYIVASDGRPCSKDQ